MHSNVTRPKAYFHIYKCLCNVRGPTLFHFFFHWTRNITITFRDIVEKGGAPSVNLLRKKDAILPNWIRLPKLQGNMFQKFQKVFYFGLSNQCFSCEKIGHLAKDCLAAHVKPIAAMKNQSNSVVTTLLPHEI